MEFFKGSIWYLILYLVPKNLVSMLMGKLVSIEWPPKFNEAIIKAFVKIFKINLKEAERPLKHYKSLQEFFVRKLKPNLRPIDQEGEVIVSPCDGMMSQAGIIENGLIMQVKGKFYSIEDLLGSNELMQKFEGGYYCTIYLSPKDYHRFHSPVDGEIIETRYLPGSLWPVNNWAVNNVDNLFCLNERIISIISERNTSKHLAYIPVGATMVGKIRLEYCDLETNKEVKCSIINHEIDERIYVAKGQELGKFMFGSTVVMLMEKGLSKGFINCSPNKVMMGEALAKLKLG